MGQTISHELYNPNNFIKTFHKDYNFEHEINDSRFGFVQIYKRCDTLKHLMKKPIFSKSKEEIEIVM